MSIKRATMIRDRHLQPGAGPLVVGILNVTPDSFSDGGAFVDPGTAVEAGCRMADEGADVVDVGGESTRPGSSAVSAEEQIRRTKPVIAELSRRFGAEGPAISIDTRFAAVAKAALDAGARIINDVSALRDDPEMAAMIAERGAGAILMHMKGTPTNMQDNPVYRDVVAEVRSFLAERIEAAVGAGIARERIIVDPGIGFGKTTEHNLEILRRIGKFRSLGVPVMVGPSRKRFIGQVLGIENPADRLMGTMAAAAACVLSGVELVRVHDVAAARQVVDLCAAIRG
ncbi:MAG TPA: dihydropteroate synthase [Phycisphaerae bacterium]|nr:dihydropteroate synthase [Phycisphaerae bacterium]